MTGFKEESTFLPKFEKYKLANESTISRNDSGDREFK